jgi:methionine-rich copper-binding protein CopC
MPRSAPAAPRRLVARLAATTVVSVAAAVLATLGTAAPASAHTALHSSSPADGATLPAAPAQVRLGFTEAPSADPLDLAVTLDRQVVPPAGPVRVEGNDVVAPVSLPGPGTYTVAYRVVSSDGHPVTGTVRFTVTGGSASPAADAAGGTAPSPATSAKPSPSTSAAAPVQPPHDASRWPLVVIALVLLVLVGIAVVLVTGPKPPKRNRF